MLQNGPFSPKPARLPFFKLIRAFRFASLHVTKTAFWAVLGGFVGSHPGVCFSGRFRLYLETATYYCRENDKNGQKTTRRAWRRRS
jgi:hypothetical protein